MLYLHIVIFAPLGVYVCLWVRVKEWSQHFSAELHVLVMLKWFGAEGSQSPPKWLRDNLGLSKGTVNSYVNRAVDALLSLKD